MLFTVCHIGKSLTNPDLFDVDLVSSDDSRIRISALHEGGLKNYGFDSRHKVTIEKYVPTEEEVAK